MTAQDIAREMKLIADAPGDPEADHMSGEDLLLSALRLATLEWPSFEQIADDFERARQKWWYA